MALSGLGVLDSGLGATPRLQKKGNGKLPFNARHETRQCLRGSDCQALKLRIDIPAGFIAGQGYQLQ